MKLFVTDELWERVQPLLPSPPQRRFRFPGRKPLDYRKILTGILFVLKTGMPWDDLPAELGCGCGKTCHHYLQLWHQAGVWRQLHQLLLTELNGADQIDWERALIDASYAKAPEGGEDTGPNPTDRSKSGSKHHVMTDAQGIPLAATVTAANVNDVTQVFQVLTDLAAVGGKPGPQREKPERLQGDRGYDSEPVRKSCVGWASLRCWANAIPSMAAASEYTVGSWSERFPGCIRSGGCGAAWIASLRFKRRSCVWPVLLYV